jgi:hypothetical protein
LIRKIESEDLPVQARQAIHELPAYLNDRKASHLMKARELGASSMDIAEALGFTAWRLPQAALDRTGEPRRTHRDPDLETPQPS